MVRIRLLMQEKPGCKFDPWVGEIPWSRKGLPTPVFLPGTGDSCLLNKVMSFQQEHGLSFHLFRSSFSDEFFCLESKKFALLF